ncbi:MAG TPA: TonB-dependent receptor [Gemmatimonadales bacterium]|nr:TonB-dependent receptor [Gemmatimonadales bacterium]
MARATGPWLRSLVLALATAVPASAQSGTLSGKVSAADGGKPIPDAAVSVQLPNGAVLARGATRGDGSYRLTGVAPGTYLVKVSAIRYTAREIPGITVTAGGTLTVDAILEARPAIVEELITTASRVAEKQTDAPAATFVIGTEEVKERPALTAVDHIRSVPGVDISQGGLVQSNVVARGFNNIFSGALLTLIDYRYAAVPSLRVNVATFFPMTNDDIEKVEFVLGPGAALYGPNAANGVLNILTKSPFASTGGTISFEGGARAGSRYASGGAAYTDNGAEIWRASGRYASRAGTKAALKLSGSYLKGTEWRERDPAEPADLATTHPELGLPAGRCNAQTGCRDFNLEQWGGEARLDVRPDADTEIIGTFGLTDAESLIEYTGIGAAQARGWKYTTGQIRFRHKRLFVQGFGNFSGAGMDSSGGTPRAKAFLFRDGNPIVDQSRVWSAQFQHGFDLGDRETLLYGADYIYTDARTGGTINGANEADDNIKEVGGYAHSVTRLGPKVDLVAALRVDKHSRMTDVVWSPRAGLVYKPTPTQAFRVTFNRAFSTPTNNDLFLDIRAGNIPLVGGIGYDVRALGVPSKGGFQFRVDGGCTGGIGNLCMRTPFNPAAGVLPARAAALWAAAVTGVSGSAGPQLTALMLSAPPTTEIGTQLRLLNPTTRQFVDVAPEQVRDIEPLKPTINHEIEAGYKALVGGRFQVSLDGWYEHKTDFGGPLIVESPNVFLDRATTIQYLTDLFTRNSVPNPAATAQAIGTGMAGRSAATTLQTTGVPLGTVVPTNSSLTARPDIFLTYRNFGKVSLWGGDVALDYVVNTHLSLAGSYSWVNKDFFPRTEVNGPTDVALNASKSKGSVTVGWRDDPGRWSAEVRFRALKGFPVNSGVYVSPSDPSDPGRLLPTDSYGVFDLQGTWRPPFGDRSMLVSANVQNLLNRHYSTFVGVPNLGRLFLTKLAYTF